MKAFLAILSLAVVSATTPATVTGPVWCLETTGNPTSQASVVYAQNASGAILKMQYATAPTFNGNGVIAIGPGTLWYMALGNQPVTTDGYFVFNNQPYYCGKTLAEGLLAYCAKTNQ